ncbi:uncharacterized protein LOC114259296 [Camellia sinensis]|uniref:uncharacterized protein LOC114259296 n=1 Tax=Camellia sinensis TaxID=4442 RepID=UPI00103630AC|nr:uncharacterized protein LOC114259296 [Camellia sinensis]
MALCRDEVLVKRFFHCSPPARSILVPIETRSNRAVPTGDRFCTLPIEIKLNILEHIPFEEAARTSILSSTSNWSEHSQVILDKLLFEERGRWIALHPTAWVNKVTEILTIHREGLIPIRKFILHIPDMQFNWALYINIWISFLSSNGIKALSVDNWNIITYKLSSFLLECYELTRLMLRNCIFKQPVEGFRNLQFLCLEKIAFGSDIVGDVTLSTPSLVQAELVDCMGFRYLNIHAPELKNFVVASSDRMRRHDLNQVKLQMARPTRHRHGRKPGYRLEFFFCPHNDTKFVFCSRSQRAGR